MKEKSMSVKDVYSDGMNEYLSKNMNIEKTEKYFSELLVQKVLL